MPLASIDLAQYRQATKTLPEAQTALNLLEKNQDIDTAIEQLIDLQSGTPQTFGSRPPLWPLLKTRLQQEICGPDDSFRTLLTDLKKNPTNATIAIAAITYLINLAGLPIPIEASLATAILIRIADIGLDVFCDYTTPPAPKPQNKE
jgi:hypothetical protein